MGTEFDNFLNQRRILIRHPTDLDSLFPRCDLQLKTFHNAKRRQNSACLVAMQQQLPKIDPDDRFLRFINQLVKTDQAQWRG